MRPPLALAPPPLSQVTRSAPEERHGDHRAMGADLAGGGAAGASLALVEVMLFLPTSRPNLFEEEVDGGRHLTCLWKDDVLRLGKRPRKKAMGASLGTTTRLFYESTEQ